MRMNRSMAGLGLAAALAAQASDLTITAFDGTGRLTFQEAPPAASYRVEWTTNLGSGGWSAQPPGLPAIPALGAGSQTVTVAVAHATCFYRVVAVGTNEPPADLTNAFELGDEGW